jgi:hypothetical protein
LQDAVGRGISENWSVMGMTGIHIRTAYQTRYGSDGVVWTLTLVE